MTREEVLAGLRLIHVFYGSFEGHDAGFRIYRGDMIDDAVREAIPAAIELLKVVELSPPPADPPRGESSVAIHEHNISALSQWVEGLETALHRVEERLETVEAYNSQSFSEGMETGRDKRIPRKWNPKKLGGCL